MRGVDRGPIADFQRIQGPIEGENGGFVSTQHYLKFHGLFEGMKAFVTLGGGAKHLLHSYLNVLLIAMKSSKMG